MNFLLRNPSSSVSSLPPVPEDKQTPPRPPPAKTLEGLIAEDPFPFFREDVREDNHEGHQQTFTEGPAAMDQASIRSHIDVSEENGWILVPRSM